MQIPEPSKEISESGREISRKYLRHWHRPNKQDLILMILSFIIAFCLWVYLAVSVSPTVKVTFEHLPVKISLEGTKAESYRLSLIDDSDTDDDDDDGDSRQTYVNCEIVGSRTAIGGLSKSDLEAYVDFDSAENTSGRQVLPIRLRALNGANISSYSLSRSEMEVTMDWYETRTFKVREVRHPGVTTDNKETVINEDKITFEPSEVEIYGPTSRLSAIDHICITLDETEKITQERVYTGCTHYSLIDSRGQKISDDAFKVKEPSFTVTIPVTYYCELPLTVEIQKPPRGFNTEELLKRIRLNSEYTLPGYGENPLNITIATDDPAKKAMLDTMDSWTLDKIQTSALSISGKPLERDIKLETGYTDSSNLGTVYISLDSTDLSSKSVWVKNSDILLMNGPPGFNYNYQSPNGNTPVTLIGTQEALDKIVDGSDLYASVSLINLTISEEGTQNVTFNVDLPDSAGFVWVSPLPSVNITVTLNRG